MTYLKTEHLGNTEIDGKAIFDLYCENSKGEKYIAGLRKYNAKRQYLQGYLNEFCYKYNRRYFGGKLFLKFCFLCLRKER